MKQDLIRLTFPVQNALAEAIRLHPGREAHVRRTAGGLVYVMVAPAVS